MKIIQASERYIDEILSLCKACSQNMLSKMIDQWDEVYPNKEVFLQDIRNNSLYLARAGDTKELMGCIVLNEHQEPEYQDIAWKFNEGKIAVIHRLMIHPQHEGKGIAHNMVGFIEQLAKEKKYSAIRLDVFVKNPWAVNFYNKLGYDVSGKVTFRKGEFFCCEKNIFI